MDALTDWLREVGTNAVVLCRSRMPAPWGMRISAQEGVMFHIVTDGACWLLRDSASPERMLQGDFVLLPQGLDHAVVDDPSSPAEPLETFLARPSIPLTGKAITTLVCGVYLSDALQVHPMLYALPPVVHFPASSVRSRPGLASTLALLTTELEQSSPGSEALIHHLFDALFVYILRAWAEETAGEGPGWLSALKHPSLSKAIAAMHADPGKPWTVESLAEVAGMSRAAFARRFAALVGEPPLAYLTRWRMIVAARLLQSSKASLAEVASQVGYESEFAFSRAFKRSRGVAPTPFRQTPCLREAGLHPLPLRAASH